jgi:effector-binding domain-containing protein
MTTPDAIAPVTVERPAQPYAGITRAVPMGRLNEVADRIPEIFGWLDAHGGTPAGPPFFRYHVIDMAREMVVEAGVPVAEPLAGDEVVHVDTLPAGRYVTLTWIGPPDSLVAATDALLKWAAGRGLVWDRTDTPEGQRWAGRLEFYHTNPAQEPDPTRWSTELAFRLADSAQPG